jgi:hypothetical protein
MTDDDKGQVMQSTELELWCRDAETGSSITYYRGFNFAICWARERLELEKDQASPRTKRVVQLANAARALSDAGSVHLTQRRELREMKDGTGFRVHYHYIATRARAKAVKPVKPPMSASQVEKAA